MSSTCCAHSYTHTTLQNVQLSSDSVNVKFFLQVAPFGNASNCRSLRQHDAAVTCVDLIRMMSSNESCPYRTLAFRSRLDLWLRNQMWNTPKLVGPDDRHSVQSCALLSMIASDAGLIAQSRRSPTWYCRYGFSSSCCYQLLGRRPVDRSRSRCDVHTQVPLRRSRCRREKHWFNSQFSRKNEDYKTSPITAYICPGGFPGYIARRTNRTFSKHVFEFKHEM